MSDLTVGDLKRMLEDFDDDTPVRLMTQKSWPFENALDGVVDSTDIIGEDGESYQPKEQRWSSREKPDRCVYLIEGEQIGYGTKDAWNLV